MRKGKKKNFTGEVVIEARIFKNTGQTPGYKTTCEKVTIYLNRFFRSLFVLTLHER